MFLKITERAFFYLLFLFQMGVATALFYADTDNDAYLALQGSAHLPIIMIQLSLTFVAALLIATRWRRVAGAALKVWPILLLAGLQMLSIAWSIHPMLTARKAVLEIIIVSIGIYMGERYTTEEFSRLFANVLCLAMGAVIILGAVAPHFIIDHSEKFALKGLSQNKNGFGFYIGLTAAILLIVRFKRNDWLRYIWVPAAFGLLLLSRSMTSVASAAVIIASLPLWLIARLPARQRVAGYIVLSTTLVISCVLVLTYSAFLLGLMGKDSTFTGRTEVWEQLIFAIKHHPWLGYGYGAFWTGLSGESLDVLIAAGWIVPSAHNAYLELWLAVGIPGIGAALLIFWRAFRMAFEYIRMVPGWAALWPIACILFIMVHGLGESEFIFDSSFACSLFTALFTSLTLETAPQRSKTVSARLPHGQARRLIFRSAANSPVSQA